MADSAPIFAPDGTIRQIPADQIQAAMASGGKLAVQMKAPDGSLRYIPHDQVGAAQKAGGVVNTEQGTPGNTEPKEGFWHSLGSVFGITPETMQASQQEYERRGGGVKAAAGMTTDALTPHPVDTVKSMGRAVASNTGKAYEESKQSSDALQRGDITAFLAHQIGTAGYTGAAVLSPLTGEGPAKAGEQIGEGNVKGALGTATGVIAPILIGGEAENIGKGARGTAGTVGKVANAVTGVIDPDIAGIFSPRLAHFLRVAGKVGKVLSPTEEAEAAAASKANAVPADSGPAPAPYRLSGNQIQDAVTVTPRAPFQPKGLLPAAPEEVAPAKPPLTSQVLKDSGVTQAMKEAGIAAPSASARAVRPGTTPQLTPRADLTIPPGITGEDAALMQLTRQNINELRFIAQKRGLPVTPKDTHTDLIGKIHDSLTPDELNGFTAAAQASKVVPSQFPENNLMAKNLNDAASQLQAAKGSPYEIASLRNAANTIQQYPKALSEVDLSTTKIRGIDKRIGKRINDFLQQQKAVPVDEDQVQTTTGQPMSLYEAMRQSLIQRGIKPPN